MWFFSRLLYFRLLNFLIFFCSSLSIKGGPAGIAKLVWAIRDVRQWRKWMGPEEKFPVRCWNCCCRWNNSKMRPHFEGSPCPKRPKTLPIIATRTRVRTICSMGLTHHWTPSSKSQNVVPFNSIIFDFWSEWETSLLESLDVNLKLSITNKYIITLWLTPRS